MNLSFAGIIRGIGLSTIGPVVGAALNIATIKVLAVTLGPSGTGFYSLVKQFVQSCTILATVNSQGVVVQAVAARSGPATAEFNLRAVARTLLCTIVCVAGIVWLGAAHIASWIAPQYVAEMTVAIRLCAPIVALAGAASFVAAVLNGMRLLGTLALGQVCGALAALALVVPVAAMVPQKGESVLLILLATSQLVALLMYFVSSAKAGAFDRGAKGVFSGGGRSNKRFWTLCAAALTTGLATAGTMLLVRALVAQKFGLQGAGIFDAAYTISAGYIGLVLGGFGTYYLPTLAATVDAATRIAFMRKVLWLVTGASIPLFAGMALFQGHVIGLLYSKQYLDAGSLLRLFLIGDFLKATSWIFAYLALAFPNPRLLLASELVWNSVFLLLTIGALHYGLGLKAIGVAYILAHFAYLVLVWSHAVRAHGLSVSLQQSLFWGSGLALIGLSSVF